MKEWDRLFKLAKKNGFDAAKDAKEFWSTDESVYFEIEKSSKKKK